MIRVFIIEDSATIRRQLTEMFRGAGDFEVVGQAATVEKAIEAIPRLLPDLVSLDVFLPDGTAADVVRRILAVAPIPIVLLSEAQRDAEEVFEALAAGALDFMRKPRTVDKRSNAGMLHAMRALSRVKVGGGGSAPAKPNGSALSVLTVASSTGGPNALRELLGQLPGDFPLPIVVAQHVAEGFEDGLARWLAAACPLRFKVCPERTVLEAGQVLLGPAGWDLQISTRSEVVLTKAPDHGYHPSADVLFSSATKVFGPAVLAVVLSGIGADGTLGGTAVAKAGGVVMAQDQRSSVVFGMPGSVTSAGVVSLVGSPSELGRAILQSVEAASGGRAAGSKQLERFVRK